MGEHARDPRLGRLGEVSLCNGKHQKPSDQKRDRLRPVSFLCVLCGSSAGIGRLVVAVGHLEVGGDELDGEGVALGVGDEEAVAVEVEVDAPAVFVLGDVAGGAGLLALGFVGVVVGVDGDGGAVLAHPVAVQFIQGPLAGVGGVVAGEGLVEEGLRVRVGWGIFHFAVQGVDVEGVAVGG